MCSSGSWVFEIQTSQESTRPSTKCNMPCLSSSKVLHLKHPAVLFGLVTQPSRCLISFIMAKYLCLYDQSPYHGSNMGSIPHMSLAYSCIVRSLLNLYEPAVFSIDILVHLCHKPVKVYQTSAKNRKHFETQRIILANFWQSDNKKIVHVLTFWSLYALSTFSWHSR